MNAYRDFWDVHPDEVPGKTGAASVMDCADIQDVLANLRLDLSDKFVVDVGCGTGRMAQLCDQNRYVGFDVAPGMVAHARQRIRAAFLIDGPAHLAGIAPDDIGIVLCLSVFTHLPRSERQAYLAAFACLTDEVLVDILDGEEGGSIAVWFADRDDFEADLVAAGFTEFDSYKRRSPDGAEHRYYHARKP